ncbi:hypothetical protein [Absidia glauca]|uniref:Uncharacterized protein n=1 Tax=Absidia glauca TaxID=4829 RepID=A0A163J8Z7_ABSGL|nr:hypothetical protein [Absidia glauca]
MILSPATATRYNEVVYDDLHTSQWWSDLQRSVGDDDVVILPLMLSSDATLVSGNGKNKAWPIYMTIGNVPKGVRYKKEYGACRVLGYLPVINVLPEYAGKPWISKCKMAIYHHCMKLLMAPFSGSTSETKFFQGPFGSVYKCLPRLATYSADYPEQNLLALTKSWTNGYGCPRCTVESSEYRKGVNGVAVRRSNSNMIQFASTEDFGTVNLRNAFWDTPFDIYDALTVDDLHQLGGVYRHLIGFVEKIIKQQRGKAALVQQRCKGLPHYTGMKRFDKGFLLSSLTNPTYDEFRKHMQLVLCLVYDLIPLQCTLCIRAFVDFFTQINSKEHTEATLSAADEYLHLFYLYLPCFQDLSAMKAPKIHMLTKYTRDIRLKGPLDDYSTMNSERMHQVNAKKPAKRTNYRDHVSFTTQLGKFVEDRDACIDMYGPPPSPSAPLQETPTKLALITLLNDDWARRLDDLERHDQQLYGLRRSVVLYLDSITRQRSHPISVSRCMQLHSLDIKLYQHMVLAETNEDGVVNRTSIRTGQFYNKTYNDNIKAVDVTKTISESDQHPTFYGKVLYFLEVTYGNMKKYRLCVGQLYEDLEIPHPTGYKTLKLLRPSPASSPTLFICCIEHIISKVFVIPDFGHPNDDIFLLNHDIEQHAWTGANPLLPSLDHIEDWHPDNMQQDDTDEEEDDDLDPTDTPTIDQDSDDDDNRLEDFSFVP